MKKSQLEHVSWWSPFAVEAVLLGGKSLCNTPEAYLLMDQLQERLRELQALLKEHGMKVFAGMKNVEEDFKQREVEVPNLLQDVKLMENYKEVVEPKKGK